MIYLTMDLPVQPRPDVPAPLAGPVAIRSQQKMRWIIVGGILSIVGLLLALPVVFSRKKGTTRPYPYNEVQRFFGPFVPYVAVAEAASNWQGLR